MMLYQFHRMLYQFMMLYQFRMLYQLRMLYQFHWMMYQFHRMLYHFHPPPYRHEHGVLDEDRIAHSTSTSAARGRSSWVPCS
jgi:hypothetical protein